MINQGKKQSAESSCGPPAGNADVGQFDCCPSFLGERSWGWEMPSKATEDEISLETD